jgi:hypothetical protein
MSATNTFENELMLFLFNNTTIAGVGDTTGLVGSSTAGNLWLSLHTGDPGEAGNQSTNECTYTGYGRTSLARSGAGWTVTGNSVSPAAIINFPPETTNGTVSETASWFGVGSTSAGTGKLMFKGAISPTISISAGVTPQLTTGTAITAD